MPTEAVDAWPSTSALMGTRASTSAVGAERELQTCKAFSHNPEYIILNTRRTYP
jgi:hypothetical protein